MPDDLFTCETLLRLKLISYMGYDLNVPLSVRISSLKIPNLAFVRFINNGSAERLFSSCELLEELTLMCCTCDRGYHVTISTGLLRILKIEECFFVGSLFEIDAPNLAHLTYRGNIGVKLVPSRNYSCSLAKAELEFIYYVMEMNGDAVNNDCLLLKAAAYKVTELNLVAQSLEVLLTLPDHEQMPEFHGLSRLHFHSCPYHVWKYVTSLLVKSPQLETVIFHEGFHTNCDSDPVSPPNEVLPPFSCHAKVIEVDDFYVSEYSLLYLKYLLRNARVLKKLILYKRGYIGMEEQL